MLKNYLTIAIRNLMRHEIYSLINILGSGPFAPGQPSVDGIQPDKGNVFLA